MLVYDAPVKIVTIWCKCSRLTSQVDVHGRLRRQHKHGAGVHLIDGHPVRGSPLAAPPRGVSEDAISSGRGDVARYGARDDDGVGKEGREKSGGLTADALPNIARRNSARPIT